MSDANIFSDYRYKTGDIIINGDMFRFTNGTVGFVIYDTFLEDWTIKYYNIRKNIPRQLPLKRMYKIMAERLI